MKKEKNKDKKLWFRGLKNFLKIFIRKPKFVYLGEKIDKPSIILSNHVGKTAPLTLELYLDTPFKFWGTHEMNENLKEVYKYLSELYYPKKLHWNLFLAKVFCLLAAPLVYIFYRGLQLISTYPDSRFRQTINKSFDALKDKKSIVIFPEDSTNGYFDEMKEFSGGFVVFAKNCYKKGIDLPIYVTYLKKKERVYIIDKPIYYSEFEKQGLERDEICKLLCDRANELGKYQYKIK